MFLGANENLRLSHLASHTIASRQRLSPPQLFARTADSTRLTNSCSGSVVPKMSHPVNTTISPSSGKTISSCPPKPLAIHTSRCESFRASSHHLNPYLSSSSACIIGATDSLTHSFGTICFPSHVPSCRYK